MYAFSCFISIFDDNKAFASMPWKEREKLFYQYSGVFVCDKTLSHWCKKLIVLAAGENRHFGSADEILDQMRSLTGGGHAHVFL